MRTPSSSKRPEPTSFSHWSKDRTLSRDMTTSKQNENLSKDNFIAGAKTTSTKGFIIPKPNGMPTGYSKALRTATFKVATNNLRPSSKAPLREVQDNKDSYQNGVRKITVRTGSSQQRVDTKEGIKTYGRESSLVSNKNSSSRLYALPPTSKGYSMNAKEQLKTNESVLTSSTSRKISTDAGRVIKAVNSKYDHNASQDHSFNQRKTSTNDNTTLSTPISHRPNYHAFPSRVNRITQEKNTEEEETQKISRPKTIHDNIVTPRQDSERDTQGSSNSDTYGSSEKKSKLREILENATNYKAPELPEKTKEVVQAPSNPKKERESLCLSSEEKRREARISSHISITSTPHATSEPRGLVGLRNIGNTCFMNSTLQCLFNTPLFTDYFLRGNHLKEKNPRSKGLADAFASLLEKMRSHKGAPSRSAESTYDVKNRISKVNSIFSGYEQHDAQELLKAVLEGINDDLNRVVTKPAYRELTVNPNKKIQDTSDEWFDYMLGRDNSIVTDLFCGQLLSKTRCTFCNHESLAFDNFWDLALSFTKGGSAKSQANLHDMMEQFLKEEDLDDLFHCEKCKVRRQSKKKFVLWRLPKVLVIQLKRFEYTKWRREKINKSVVFPVKSFDLNQFVTESTDSSVRDAKYTLFGMVNHGGSLSGGHYTAECMNVNDRKWYNFNDSSVSESFMKGDKSESSAPYILFYLKSSCLSN